MRLWNFVRRGVYQDSVTLMRLTRDLEGVAGVRRAAVMMGTPENRAILRTAELLAPEAADASPTDLVIAITADDGDAAETARAAVVIVMPSNAQAARLAACIAARIGGRT